MNPQPRRPQDSHKAARKVTRLEGFDYSSEGAYFVTLVTKNRQHLFGEIVNEEMVLNDFGRIVVEEAAQSAREKSAEDQNLLTRSLEDDVLRQLLLRILIRLDALEKR